MKRILSSIIIIALMLLTTISLSACDTPKEDQSSDLAIESIYQSSNGDVLIKILNADKYINENLGDNAIEVSIDGGIRWFTYAYLDEVNRKDIGLVLHYDHTNVKFINYDFTYNIGDTISVTARLIETDNKNASEQCTPLEYTLKAQNLDGLNIIYGVNLSDEGNAADYLDMESYSHYSYMDNEHNLIKLKEIDIANLNYTLSDTVDYSSYEYQIIDIPDDEIAFHVDYINRYNIDDSKWLSPAVNGFSYDDESYIKNTNNEDIINILIRIKETSSTNHSKAVLLIFIKPV